MGILKILRVIENPCSYTRKKSRLNMLHFYLTLLILKQNIDSLFEQVCCERHRNGELIKEAPCTESSSSSSKLSFTAQQERAKVSRGRNHFL